MPFQPLPCPADDPVVIPEPCCSPGIASTGLCLGDGTPIAVMSVSACAECGGAAAAPAVSGWINLLTGAYTAGPPPAGSEPCLNQPQQFEVGQWCDLDAAGEVIAPVLVEYEYDDQGQLIGVRTLTPAGDPYVVAGTLGLCPQAVGEPQYVELCDVQPDGSAVRFLRGYTPNGDGTANPDDIALDGTAYTPTGTVGACEPCASAATLELCDTVVVGDEETRTPFLRVIRRDCETGELLDVLDTDYDGQPYTPAGTVAPCDTFTGRVTGRQIVERCGCDDANGDGSVIVRYVELWAVDTAGVDAPELLGTWVEGDFDQPYTPANPVDCPGAGGTGPLVFAQHANVTSGAPWTLAAVTAGRQVTSVTYTVVAGTGSATDSNGTVLPAIPAGFSATWSSDDEGSLAPPVQIAADPGGRVLVHWTEGA